MKKYQQDLIHLIAHANTDPTLQSITITEKLNSSDLSKFFIEVSFLITCLDFLQEQHWILSKEIDKEDYQIIFSNFTKKYFKAELAPLLFFHATLENSTVDHLQVFKKNAIELQQQIVINAKQRPILEKNEFATCVLKSMSELFEFEYQLFLSKQQQNQNVGYSLYRSFDILDDFFNLNYDAEKLSAVELNSTERLYIGSSAAVQSSYTTILLALRYLRISSGSRFIDLGSGFGRVGLTIGLIRPDIQFTGYEFVDKRVQIASAASCNLGLQKNVQFFTQDLAAKDFSIPVAETYYLYDPFDEETYKHVIAQLNLIAAKMKINVITKGNAKNYFNTSSQRGIWSRPQEFDSGNFCLFRSH